MAEKSEQIEENLVKKTCRELGITQKELAEIMSVTPKAVSDWATKRVNIPKNFQMIIELIKYKKDCEAFKRAMGINIMY
jgi:transcriptional regulator with XRE-family HTH domain